MHVLLFIEAIPHYNAINNNLTILGVENMTAHLFQINMFACPSDPEAARTQTLAPNALTYFGVPDPAPMMYTSYTGCTGSFETTALPHTITNCVVPGQAVAQNNGCFHDVAPIHFASITDGLSNTILLAERSVTAMRMLDEVSPTAFPTHGWSIRGNWGDTLTTCFYPPNAFKMVAARAITAQLNSTSSLHPSGLNVLMGDGSVRFIKEAISTWPFDPLSGNPVGATRTSGGWWQNTPPPGVWQALPSRGGGEAVGTDSF